MSNDDPLRIATALHSPLLGGSQIATVELATELRRRGHQVDLFVIDEPVDSSVMPLAAEAGFEVEVLPRQRSMHRQARLIRRYVERKQSQVLHVYNEHHWLGALAALALRSSPSCEAVVTNWMMEHHPWIPPHAPLIVGFESLAADSRRLRRGPVWLLEPPVNTELDKPGDERGLKFRIDHRLEDDEVAAVLIGRVDHVMKLDGILRTIRAVEHLDDDGARFFIVGDGDAMDVVEQRVSEVNTRLGRKAITTTGVLQDPRPAYEAADIVVAMGSSAIRGLAFAKPVVVLGAGSFSKVFEPRSLDHFIDQGFYGHDEGDDDGHQLAQQLRSLMDPDRRRELGAFGKQTIDDHYSLDVMAERLEQIYRSAIEQPLSTTKRWMDAAWGLGYGEIATRIPPSLRDSVRRRIRGV